MKLGFNKIFFILLAFLIVVDIISAYLLFNIDQIVNGDLYHFGLNFDINWANKYWPNMETALLTSWISLLLSGFLIGLLYFRDLKSSKKVLVISSILLLSITFVTVISIFSMTVLDKLVSVDLELYGVQYDFQWTHNYYLVSRLFLGLKIVAAAVTTLFSSWTMLLLLKLKQTIPKLVSITLLIVGALLVLISTLLTTQIIHVEEITQYSLSLSLGVNIGLGLILSGIVIGYITSQEFIKKEILTSQLTSTYGYLEENIKKFGKFDKAVYFPSYLAKDNSNTVLLLKKIRKTNLETNTAKSTKIVTKAFTIIPPGNELVQLFEKKLKTNFANVNLAFLQKNLPNLIVEDLEIATNLQMTLQEESVKVEFENSIFTDNRFDQKFSDILKTFGCPLSSAIGCAIAKVTGKITNISEYSIDKQRKNTSVTYKLMQETINLTYDT